MFVSIDENVEDTYKNEQMRNFFKPKREDSEAKWQTILNEDNSKMFQIEMMHTLINVNRFITKIEIESTEFNKTVELSKENEKKFKEYLVIGRELLSKLKLLATLEKASAMEKYEQSHVRKLSYAATEDTASVIDTESMMEGYITFNKEESFDRRDSRTITLVHKYAASFTSHYEMFDKLNHDVEEIVERFNVVLDFIHQQLQFRSGAINKDGFTDKTDQHSTLRSGSDERDQVEKEIQRIDTTNLPSAIEILIEHLKKSSLTAIFRHISASGSGHLIEHTFSCNVAGLCSEGRSRKKSKAKEEAAVEMIKLIIELQKCGRLPSQIVPFTESQIHDLSTMLTKREDLIDKLEERCLHSHEPPPLYTVLSETGKSNEPYFTVKCEAMGYTAVGHGPGQSQAKKNSAKSILNLLAINRKPKFSFSKIV